jgi:hypothetical protein
MRKVMLIAVLAIAVMLVVSLSPAAGEEDEAPGHNPYPGVPNGPHEEPGESPNGPHNPYPGPPSQDCKIVLSS